MLTCPHCGEPHPDEAKFCSSTGQPIQPPVATERVRPLGQQKGIVDLFKEAAELYRSHARTFLITAAVLFIPGSFINSCTAAALLGPTMVAAPVAERAAERMARRSEELSRRIQEQARTGKIDEAAAREHARETEELARDAGQLGAAAVGGLGVFLLGLIGWAVTALILYGLLLPLTQGALTIAVADTLLGGQAGWQQHWTMLFKRLGLLVTALLPAAVFTFIGACFLLLPGLVLAFLFTFVTPVVLVEGLGGMAALKRSYQLVRSDLLRTALVLIANFVTSAIAHRVGRMFVPSGAIFFGNFLGDLLWLVIMPVPVITSVLLYFDLRRKLDGLDDEHFKAELETLRPPAV